MAFSALCSLHRSLLRRHRCICTAPTTSDSAADSELGAPLPSSAASPLLSSKKDLDRTVKRLAKSRRFADIETLVEGQKSSPKTTREAYMSSLIHVYGCAGMLDHALRTFEQMDELGAQRSAVSFNSLLSACNKSQKFDQVPSLFSEISRKYKISPDKYSYGILIKSLCESGAPESAFRVLDEMRNSNMEINGVIYTTLLDALYKKGKVEEAQRVWDELGKNGCPPDVAAYNVKIKHAGGEDPDEVLKLIDEMVSTGLKPDAISYNYLMIRYFKHNLVEEAVMVYETELQSGCLGNAATFRTLLFYLCKSGDFDRALKVFEMSSKMRRIPDFWTVKKLMEGLAKSTKEKEAKAVIKLGKKKFPESFMKAWEQIEANLGLNKGATLSSNEWVE